MVERKRVEPNQVLGGIGLDRSDKGSNKEENDGKTPGNFISICLKTSLSSKVPKTLIAALAGQELLTESVKRWLPIGELYVP
jgi:hypothetical protein